MSRMLKKSGIKKMKSWRGIDLTRRYEKIENTFNLKEIKSGDDFVVIATTPCYFGFGTPKPKNYYKDPAVMVRYQEDGFEKHLQHVQDDVIPYFMPFYGTDVLASAFGCAYKEPESDMEDPVVCGPCIATPQDIAKLKIPDFKKAGLMPRVLDTIDYAVEKSDLPVGITDANSPLSTAAKMCGYDKFFVWMYEEPRVIHDLMDIVTESFIAWVKEQKRHIGEPLNQSNGLMGVWAPEGLGVWLSDDDLVSISAQHYQEFVAKYYSRIFDTFGGGSVHFCGNGLHQVENILGIKNIRVINNSAMYNFDVFAKIAKKTDGKVALHIQDVAPLNIKENYAGIFNAIDDLKGKMITTFVCDNVAMVKDGSFEGKRDTFDVANRIADFARECVDRKLKGNDLLQE